MGILSALGLKKKDDRLEKEIIQLKETVEIQNQQNIEGIRSDIRTLFSEIQDFKTELKDCNAGIEKNEIKISKLAEKLVQLDNTMLKVVYKDEIDLLKKEFDYIQEDIKSMKDSQSQITDKFINFALNKGETPTVKETVHNEISEPLTDFEKEILSKYKDNITSEAIVKDTGMSMGHISRTLKGLHKSGYLERKRKGKEFIYFKI